MEKQLLSQILPFLASIRVKEDDSLEQVVAILLEHPGFHNVCVVDAEDHLLGVINIKRLFRIIFSHHADPNLMTRQLIELVSPEIAADIMMSEPLTALETETLGGAISKMVQHQQGELPVVDKKGQLLGSLSMHQIFNLWLKMQKGE